DGAGAGVSAGAGGGSDDSVGASSPITAMSLLTAAVVPSGNRICCRMPATGLGTSALTLSVWISTSGSSRSTRSPGCFNQRPMVPSETDSPSCGIFTTVLGIVYKSVLCQTAGRLHDVFGVGQDGLLERRRVGDVCIRGGEA